MELWFLLNRLQPDFRTIADFRMTHRKLLRKIFVVFARSCREMKLMDGETLCLDGTTIRASNGRKQSTSVELSRKKLEYARAQLEAVERFLDGMDENDLHEDRIDHPFALDLDKDHLPDPQTLRECIAFHEKCIEELEKSGRALVVRPREMPVSRTTRDVKELEHAYLLGHEQGIAELPRWREFLFGE